ncbi:hypothetical protein [Pandoraea sp. NPDC090278]|uniref:hypothetical protein n=1 Tax=Pandoraea sp. NPDC090278 TaxID=3364391 RepID=UPI00383A8EF1
MATKVRVITRAELYVKVWASPVSKVAEEFGMSGNGLRKLCTRNKVPCPQRGYWAKLQAGKDVSRIELPPRPGKEIITLDEVATESHRRRGKDIVQTKAHSFDVIITRDPAAPPHPLVTETQTSLQKTDGTISREAVHGKRRKERQARGELRQIDVEVVNRPPLIDHGRVIGSGELRHCLVSSQLRSRALALLETLILTGESGGLSFDLSGSAMFVSHNSEKAEIRIFEVLEERKNPSRDKLDQILSPMIKVPSGQLRLTIQAPSFFTLIRVSDQPKNPLENQIVAALSKTLRGLSRIPARREAEGIRLEELALKWEAAKRREDEAAARREIEQEQRHQESDRQAQFFKDAALWAECERARQYITEVLRLAKQRGPEAIIKANHWAEWATGVVDARDPVQKALSDFADGAAT